MTQPSHRNEAISELRQAMAKCRHIFIAIAVFSAVLNILALTGSIFMLEVYDRVLPSRSIPTLIALLILVVVLYLFLGLFDSLRSHLLTRIAQKFSLSMSARVHGLVMWLPLRAPRGGEGIQPIRDLDLIKAYLSGRGPTAFFDIPWLPLYLAICFAFHVWIGLMVLAGALVLVVLTWVTEVTVRGPAREAAEAGAARGRMAELGRRNAEALQALGMAGRIFRRWQAVDTDYGEAHLRSGDRSNGLGAAGRAFRMLLQSAVMAVGAYLVIHDEATGGIIIASSILSARALAPIDLAIGQWRGFVGAREAWKRLDKLLSMFPEASEPMSLPPPCANLSVEAVSVAPPQTERLTVQDVSFTLKAGDGLGIIGPSASGKSSLARALVGVWPAARGKVRLDGAALDQWVPDALGQHVGYLPQAVELFDGTVGENIARFDEETSPEAIVAAAREAGVHDLVVRLPQGYETPIGEQGNNLSAGQRQRIALARALYGQPFLVVLDEPNANLDSEGDEALTGALANIRERGGIAIVIAHRPSALAAVDQVMMMEAGRCVAFGPKEDVLTKVLRPNPPVVLTPVAEAKR